MIEKYNVRTDLALEQKERFDSDHVEVQGVVLEEEYDEESEICVTTVKIETENGARTMKRPVGTYITVEAPEMAVPDEDYHREISEKLKSLLTRFVQVDKEDYSVLVVGLGNRQVTPDALGPFVADHLNITRHVVKEYGKYAMGEEAIHLVSAIVPGVMGQTGMETVEIIRGVVQETKPDLIIAVDALAARSSRRLNRTIQIADTGIHPGSGVGNHRNGITEETVGVPVIAIGVPTVVDAATIVNDTMENFLKAIAQSKELKSVSRIFSEYSPREKYELIREVISPEMVNMYVTPKDIDANIKTIGHILAKAIDMACEDLQMIGI